MTCCSSGRACACWRSAGSPGDLWPPCAGEWGSWRERPSSQRWPCCRLTSLWWLGGTQVSGGTVGHPPARSPRATEHRWGRGAEWSRGCFWELAEAMGGKAEKRREREEEEEVGVRRVDPSKALTKEATSTRWGLDSACLQMSFSMFVRTLGVRFRWSLDKSLFLCWDKSCCYPPKSQCTASSVP